MSLSRKIALTGAALGSVLVLFGLGLFLVPGVAESLPINLVLANIAAAGAIALAGWMVRDRYRAGLRETFVPDVEFPFATSSPGSDIDEMIYRLTELRERTIEYREQIKETVGEIAIGVIMQRDDCSREQAVQQLRDGTWTDDRTAASYFAGGGTDESTSLVSQVRQRFTDAETEYERQLRATVAAIEEQASAFADIAAPIDRQQTADDEDATARWMDKNEILLDDEGDRVTPTTRYRRTHETHHWKGVSAFALAAVSMGIFLAQPVLLLASAVSAAAAGYARLLPAPTLSDMTVTRTLDEESPQPSEEVEVSVTVENEGDTFLSDLRLIDRVPSTMRVVDGSPRLGTALRPGQSATFTYTLIAERGEHSWPVQVVGRDVTSSWEREAYVEPESETELHCVPSLRSIANAPVRMQTSMYSGQVNTESGGDGLEFYSLRDYLPGDPMRRINWKQYARTGEFSTIEFREEKAARVVLLFDTRESSYVSRSPGERHAVELSVDAAFDAFGSLYDQGHLVGIAAFDTVPCWLGPSTGDVHLERARQLFVNHPALSPLPPDVLDKEGRYVDPMTHVRRQLPSNTQIFLFSPLTDDYAYEVARRLNGAGHLITIISPDPTASDTTGERLARLERTVRVLRLREHGIRVVDWDLDQSLRLEFERARKRWT